MFLVVSPGVAKLGNICFGRNICVREAKMFLTLGKKIFVFRAAKFVSATHVSRAAKLGNICIRNNVSQFSQAFIQNLQAFENLGSPVCQIIFFPTGF